MKREESDKVDDEEKVLNENVTKMIELEKIQ